MIQIEDINNTVNFLNEIKNGMNNRFNGSINTIAKKYKIPYAANVTKALGNLGIAKVDRRGLSRSRFILTEIQPKHARDLIIECKKLHSKTENTTSTIRINGEMTINNYKIKGQFDLLIN